MINAFLISSPKELSRKRYIAALHQQLPTLKTIQAIYPAYEKVPFIKGIQTISSKRTGKMLSLGEIGCLLSHRKVWREIVASTATDQEGFLIVESDSVIQQADFLLQHFTHVHEQYDLFFWGAYDGRMQLRRKHCKQYQGYKIGTPVIPSLFCTYGYSINKQTAYYLLKKTATVNYPVDYWRIQLRSATLRVGGIKPQIISTSKEAQKGSINEGKQLPLWFNTLVDIRNFILSFT